MPENADGGLLEAWRRATDADVSRALGELLDYPPEAQTIIRQEAARRGVTSELGTIRPELPESFFFRLLCVLARFLWRHRFLTATLCGFIIHAGLFRIVFLIPRLVPRNWRGPLSMTVVTFSYIIFEYGVYVACIMFFSRPLRSYRRVLGITAGVALGSFVYSLPELRPVWDAIFALIRFPNPRQFPYPYRVVEWLFIPWLIDLTIVCAIVFIRNRYWPDYGPGKCAKCGYDLRGLPTPRCPECGRPFQPIGACADPPNVASSSPTKI